jgi:hypothetical protein
VKAFLDRPIEGDLAYLSNRPDLSEGAAKRTVRLVAVTIAVALRDLVRGRSPDRSEEQDHAMVGEARDARLGAA